MTSFEEYLAHLEQRVPPLSPAGAHDDSLSRQLQKADLFAGKSGDMAECCRAGLLIWNDDLENSHNIVQDIKNQTGSFWHAIIHRREGDFSNARYWWNLTGSHPAFEEIYDIVLHRVPDFPFLDDLRVAQAWEPYAFTAACQAGQNAQLLQEVQKVEMGTLLRWCASRVK